MRIPNLGWMYYKRFYDTSEQIQGKDGGIKLSFSFLKFSSSESKDSTVKKRIIKDNAEVFGHRSQLLYQERLTSHKPTDFLAIPDSTGFDLVTTYPGLLCGSGYSHGISSETDYKLGFFFDHTTGLPVIPGSSVKGVLRSVFPGLYENEKSERYRFVRWLITQTNNRISVENLQVQLLPNLDDDSIDELENFIFRGENKTGKQISYYHRDIFFNAFPVISLSHQGCFLRNDYITPHINRANLALSPFTNPTPLQFLKVLPKVKFQFQFKLSDQGGLLSIQKKHFFKEILLTLGIGAKTNVGYGQFDDDNPVAEKIKINNPGDAATQVNHPSKPPAPPPPPPVFDFPKSKPFDRLRNGDRITGTVVNNSNGELLFKVEVEGEFQVKSFKYASSSDYKPGSKAILDFVNKQKEKGIWMLMVKNPKFHKE